MTKGCFIPVPKKGDFGITQTYRGIALTAIAAKIYNTLLNCIIHEVAEFIGKIRRVFREIDPRLLKF